MDENNSENIEQSQDNTETTPADDQQETPPAQGRKNVDSPLPPRWVSNSAVAVVIILTLTMFAFSRPLATKLDSGGLGFQFINIISIIGFLGGLYAIFFLIAGIKGIAKLTRSSQVLTYVCILTLIGHATFAVMHTFQEFSKDKTTTTTTTNRLFPGGPQTWKIGEQTFEISNTFWIKTDTGYRYSIEYPYSGQVDANDSPATRKIIGPILQYAYMHGSYKHEFEDGGKIDQIGVIITNPDEPDSKPVNRGMDIAQLRQLITWSSLSPAAQKFFPILAELNNTQKLNTQEGLQIIANNLPLLLSLTNKDLTIVGTKEVSMISTTLVNSRPNQDEVIRNFTTIPDSHMKQLWAVLLFQKQRFEPVVMSYLKQLTELPARDAILKKMLSPEDYEMLKQKISQPATQPVTPPAAAQPIPVPAE